MTDLLQKIDESDQEGAAKIIGDELVRQGGAWTTHLSLFPVAQRVINPPFINPHLPKMHSICRDFLPYLTDEDLPPLVRLEINEYARRPKLPALPPAAYRGPVTFADVKAGIGEGDTKKTAALLMAFLEQQGKAELARKLILLGSGYLDNSLGHSVSCTAFILLEMLERADQDPWPTLTALAEYFCRGSFHKQRELGQEEERPPGDELEAYLLAATSGTGIVNLHHTITSYAIERVRHLLSDAEHGHLLACGRDFMGNKTAEALPSVPVRRPADYDDFYRLFSRHDEAEILSSLAGMISTATGRRQAGRYLIKAVCDKYRGEYDPHFLTGLGAALWVMEHSQGRAPLALQALHQYINYFLTRHIK